MASPQAIRGFRDLLPPESERTASLEAAARAVLARYCFREIRLPTLEIEELFVKSTGETTDIVEKEMFRLQDAGGRSLALRPEGTPGAVRAYLNHHLRQQGGTSKLFYLGSMFRAERPQAGRFREFEQIGVETIGNPHPAADAEAILSLRAVLEAAGLKGRLRLRLGDIGCDEDEACRPAFRSRLKAFLEKRRESLCESCRRRIVRNPLRALDCKRDGPALAAEAPKLEPCAACRKHSREVAVMLEANGFPDVAPDPTLVRGLDYYTRTVFEFTSAGLGAQDALAGGGRYDGLVEAMGGPATPAVGWALGVERTLMAAAAADPEGRALAGYASSAPPAVFVASAGEEVPAREAARLLESLRARGLSAAGGLFASGLKAQLREADRLGARYAVIVGEAELAKTPPSCLVKDLREGRQQEVPLAQLSSAAEGTFGGFLE